MTKASSRNRLWDVLRHLAFILQKAVLQAGQPVLTRPD